MGPPGGLEELGDEGRAAWDAEVGATLGTVLARLERDGRSPPQLTTDAATAPDVRTVDWPAFPARVGGCLGADLALRLLDWRPAGEGDVGRARHQEEYVEWRLIRSDDEVRGIELTTEFREYWQVLAAHEPQRTLELVAELAGEEEVSPTEVYGPLDPFAAGVTPARREAAFKAAMLPVIGRGAEPREELKPVSRYNDGRGALCCMIQPNNTLDALLALVASAARPYLVRDPVSEQARYPSGSEAIAGLGASAVDGRNSDPLLVERIVRFVTEGRPVGVDDPLGVYIREVQRHELAQPDGEDVPAEWLELSRGIGSEQAADGRSRRQRLKLELPAEADFGLTDLVVRRTGEKLRFGGQLAEIVELAAYLRTGDPQGDLADVEPEEAPERRPPDCRDEQESRAELATSGGEA